MAIHPAYADRFALLDGMESFEQLMADPVLEARFHEFMQWREATPPPSVDVSDRSVDGPHGPIPVRVYRPVDSDGSRPGFVWHHGGAFMMGDLDMPEADRTAREVCARAGAVVVSVDYRLATPGSGVHYPVPLDDCVAVARWVRDSADSLGVDADRITLGGASAGANLATGAVLRMRDEDGWQPAALVTSYGVFHALIPSPSPALEALLSEVPQVLRMPPESCAGVAANYLGGPVESADGYSFPGLADVSGLCRVLMVDAEYDDLRPSEDAFFDLLEAASVDVQRHVAPGLLHGFMNLPAEIEPVEDVVALMADLVAHPSPVVRT